MKIKSLIHLAILLPLSTTMQIGCVSAGHCRICGSVSESDIQAFRNGAVQIVNAIIHDGVYPAINDTFDCCAEEHVTHGNIPHDLAIDVSKPIICTFNEPIHIVEPQILLVDVLAINSQGGDSWFFFEAQRSRIIETLQFSTHVV